MGIHLRQDRREEKPEQFDIWSEATCRGREGSLTKTKVSLIWNGGSGQH